MSDGITDMHREEERKAAELVEACKNCDHLKINMDSAYCFDCTNYSNFRPTQSAIDAKVEELRAKKPIIVCRVQDPIIPEMLESLLGLRTSFPTVDILTRLVDATDKLLHHCSYDGQGWEVLQESMEFAKKRIDSFRQVQKYLVEKQ